MDAEDGPGDGHQRLEAIDGFEFVRLQDQLRAFAVARDWEQFHTPKNLAMALAGECGELLAEFQWLSEEEAGAVMQDPHSAEAVASEIADIAIYLLRLCDVLSVDLVQAIQAKVAINERRYPVDRSRGNAKKYSDL